MKKTLFLGFILFTFLLLSGAFTEAARNYTLLHRDALGLSVDDDFDVLSVRRGEDGRDHVRLAQGGVPLKDKADAAMRTKVSEAYGKLPLLFEANTGQTDPQVRFLSRGRGYSLFLTSTEAVLVLSKPVNEKGSKTSPVMSKIEDEQFPEPPAVLRMKLAGANLAPQIAGQEESSSKSNYFIGNEPENWRTNISNYTKVKYTGVYPGVDVIYYGNQGQLEYDFLVAPGANPRDIRLTIEGAQDVCLDGRGDLVLNTLGGEIRVRKPVVYQEVDGARREVSGRYEVLGRNQIGFQIAEYDVSRTLVIDPVLSYSTYFGNSFRVESHAIAVDSSGNAYITGTTTFGNIPLQDPLFGFGGGETVGTLPTDAFVAKLNAAGSAVVYSTYLGGNGNEGGLGIAVDSSGSAYVTGQTSLTNFPTMNPFQTTCTPLNFFNRCVPDVFVTRLNATGSALVYSTYLGGTAQDGLWTGIAVDSSGGAYVTGTTYSPDFPTTGNAFQLQVPFSPGGFLTKLNTNASGAASLIYSTYLDARDVRGVAVDSSGNAYVTGGSSGRIPSTEKAFQSTRINDVIIMKLDTNPPTCTPDPTANINCWESLVYSTSLGGIDGQAHIYDGVEVGRGIAVDSSDNVYVTGKTGSHDFPTTPGAFQPAGKDDGTGTVSDAFVTKLNINPPTCTPDPSRNINCKEALIYSTYLGGGSQSDEGRGIAIDASNNIYVTGETDSPDFPVKAPFQLYTFYDAFVAKLNPNAAGAESLVYSTFLGGSSQEQYMSIAVDSVGDAYVTGSTTGSDFPTTSGSLRPASGFGGGFVSKISPDVTPFLVSAIGPNKGGDTGLVSTVVHGLGFKSGATVKLARTGQPDIVGEFVSVEGGIRIAARFNLVGKEMGLWDVIVTNPNGELATLPQGFTIEPGRQLKGTVDIIGRNNFRPGGTGRIVVTYSNPGNVDVLLPIIIRIPAGIGFSFPFPILHQPLVPTVGPVDFSGLPTSFQRPDDPNTPENEAETIIPLIVNVPPGFTGSIPINLQHPNTNCSGAQIRVSVGYPINPFNGAECIGALAGLAAEILTEVIPGAECIKQAVELAISASTQVLTAQPASLSSWIGSILLGAVNCGADIFPVGKAIKIAVKVTDLVIGSGGAVVEAISSCGFLQPTVHADRTATLNTACVSSRDPNDKVGPKGTGAARYFSGEEALRYIILFENQPTATAPAQDVVITDQLDKTALDLSTFSLGLIAFGDKLVMPPSGLSDYTTDVDLRPAKNLVVRINARLDIVTGLLTWRFSSIDPGTGQPTDDPLAGFLPPNINEPEGDGSVFFTVNPKPDLASGTEIRNQARIVFDVNDPIDTPVWLNTIDNTKPESQVLPLAARQNSTTFEVQWSGADTGSGVASFTIFVSENGGPFTAWLSRTTATSGNFAGQPDKTYSFYSVAEDQTGNIEDAPAAPDTTTTTTTTLNTPPIANGGPGQTVRFGSLVTLDGSASFDPDNDTLSFAWAQTSGPTTVTLMGAATATPTLMPAVAGDYLFSLVVNDGMADSAPAGVTITVAKQGDLNLDGAVDCADLAIVKASFGKRCGQTGFDVRADLNNDCVVNVRDLAIVSRQIPAGTRCP